MINVYLDRFLGKRLAVNPPLRFEQRLDDVARLAAYGDLHRVVFRLNEEARVLKRLDHRDTRMEALHPLRGCQCPFSI